METGMKTNIQDLPLKYLRLPINCLHTNIINSCQVHLKYFNDLKVKEKQETRWKIWVAYKTWNTRQLTREVKTAEQLLREFASKLDAAFEQLPSMATDFSGFSVMSSGKSHCIFDLSFSIKWETVLFPQRVEFFLLMWFEELFSKKPLWDVVCQAVQTELGAVKIKPIKSNLRKESKVNRNDEKSSVDVSHNSTFSASWKYWFLKRSSRLDELLREYSKNGVDNIVENFK